MKRNLFVFCRLKEKTAVRNGYEQTLKEVNAAYEKVCVVFPTSLFYLLVIFQTQFFNKKNFSAR